MGSTPQPNTYSASQISTLIGLNPFQTSLAGFQVMKEADEPGWNKDHGYTLPPKADNAAIRWGLAFEDPIIKLAEEQSKLGTIEDREKLFTKKIDGIRLSCHVDGIFSMQKLIKGGFVIHEGKTTNHWAYTSFKKEIQNAIDLTSGQIMPGFQIVRKWGEPGTDQVPQEYAIQAAVQRICTGAELVKLSVLVFPKAQQDYEDLGWAIDGEDGEPFILFDTNGELSNTTPYAWAHVIRDMGNFHQYLLPSAPKLEQEIIKAVQKFHTEKFLPGIPPDPTDFADVKRLMPHPLGTVLATPELVTKCKEYSENVKQLGSTSPLHARQKILKPEIMNIANALRRSNPTDPPDKFLILNKDGGDQLASVSKDKNGVISFRAARAK